MSDKELKEHAEQLAENADGPDVNVNQLTGGRGARFFKTFTQKPPITYLEDDEQPHYTFKIGGPNGGKITVTGTQDTDSHTPPFEREIEPDPYILTIITNTRTLAVGQESGADNVLSIPHTAVESVEMVEQKGFLNNNTEFRITTNDYSYCIEVPTIVVQSTTDVPEFIESHSQQTTDLTEKHFFVADNTKLVCKECRGEIESDATRCPHCGFAPKDSGHGGLWHGTALATSFSPIGWAMMAKGAVDEQKANQPVGENVAVQNDTAQQKENAIDTLERLSALKEEGMITEEEFEESKQKLLKRL